MFLQFGPCEEDRDQDDPCGLVGESLRDESINIAPHSAPPEETPVIHPPASPSHPATDGKENPASDQNDNNINNKNILETFKGDVDPFPTVDIIKPKTKKESSSETNLQNFSSLKDKADTLNTDSNHLRSECRTLSDNNTPNTHLIVQKENKEPLVDETNFNQDPTLSAAVTESSKELIPASYVPSFVESMPANLENVSLFSPEVTSENQEMQSETVTDTQTQQKDSIDGPTTPKKVFTIVLEMEPQDMQVHENTSPALVEGLQIMSQTSDEFPEEKSAPLSTRSSTGYDEADSKRNPSLKGNESRVIDSLSDLVTAELEDVKSTSANLSSQETHEVIHNEISNSSKPCGNAAERELTGALAAVTTFPDVRAEEMTDFCVAEGQTMSSVITSAEGDFSTQTQTPTSDGKRQSVATSTGTGETESTEDVTGLELPECKLSGMFEGRDDVTLPAEESGWMVPASQEDAEETQTQVEVALKRYSHFFLYCQKMVFSITHMVVANRKT